MKILLIFYFLKLYIFWSMQLCIIYHSELVSLHLIKTLKNYGIPPDLLSFLFMQYPMNTIRHLFLAAKEGRAML